MMIRKIEGAILRLSVSPLRTIKNGRDDPTVFKEIMALNYLM